MVTSSKSKSCGTTWWGKRGEKSDFCSFCLTGGWGLRRGNKGAQRCPGPHGHPKTRLQVNTVESMLANQVEGTHFGCEKGILETLLLCQPNLMDGVDFPRGCHFPWGCSTTKRCIQDPLPWLKPNLRCHAGPQKALDVCSPGHQHHPQCLTPRSTFSP